MHTYIHTYIYIHMYISTHLYSDRDTVHGELVQVLNCPYLLAIYAVDIASLE